MKNLVIEYRNIGTIGKPEMAENVIFSGTQEKCASYMQNKRSQVKKGLGIMVDYGVVSEEEYKQQQERAELVRNLTEEQKNDIITVDGRKYVRAIYEKMM